MANKKRKVFFAALQVRFMMTHKLLEDREKIKSEVFDHIISKFQTAKENADYSPFQKKLEEINEVYMISLLHYRGNTICGVVSHGSPHIERYLRQCNPDTFDVKELVPDDGNIFEEYSFFAISIPTMQMAYLNDTAVSSNIPSLVISLLQPSVNINYTLEARTILDSDIKRKIRNLGNTIVIKGVLKGKEEQVVGGLPSLRTMQNAIGTRFNARINVHAKVKKKLTDEDIDIIQLNATEEAGFSSFTFTDENDSDKEIIDVIKKQVTYTKSIELSDSERKDAAAIWSKLCDSF